MSMKTDDRTYKEQFDLLTANTNEYEQGIPFIEQTILPALPQQNRFLDIGAGRGSITKALSPNFNQTTIVEPNTLFFKGVSNWATETGVKMDGFNADWFNVDFPSSDIDLTMISHVLYYIPVEKRFQFVRKAYDTLNPGGYLVILLASVTSGSHHLWRHLLPMADYHSIPSIESVLADLRLEGYRDMALILFDSEIKVKTRNEIQELIDFLVVEKMIFDNEEDIRKRDRYIDDYLTSDSGFAINDSFGVLSIRKS
uniref:Methyltransferase domain-containing protein n=1 Tax=Candidatus Kentrum sp. LPFa TaxID=2126335 RepID=A0A450WRL3_9GAMM|nr:MAG: Methyltransferase domain-containing protein [Candidatus Kentron sp. LPFa]